MKLIGLTGGIGTGKSTVARILRLRGYEVYDCDLEAKRLMDESPEVRRSLRDRWGEARQPGTRTCARRREKMGRHPYRLPSRHYLCGIGHTFHFRTRRYVSGSMGSDRTARHSRGAHYEAFRTDP